MKYFKRGNDVFAFADDGSEDEGIKDDMVSLTPKELDKHLNPYKYMSTKAKREWDLKTMPVLEKRQFKLLLLNNNLLSKLETEISKIENDNTREWINIEYNDSLDFVRTEKDVLYFIELLKLKEEDFDKMWKIASSY